MDSFWIDSIMNKQEFDKLNKNIETDVCIVGGGIFGISCAYYLSNLGYKVCVLEKYKIAEKTSGHTTAKITSQHGLFYNYLINSYGEKFANNYLTANEEAIKNIKSIIDTEKISCDFEYQNSYVYTTKKSELRSIKKEVSALDKLGFQNCNFVTKIGLPFNIEGAICFKKQAQFNPLKYIFGLTKSITNNDGKIYIDTTVTDIKQNGDEYVTFTNNHTVKSKYVIVASHYPFINFPGFYFAKMYQSTSYVMAVDTKKTLFNGMYINFTNPIISYRTAKWNNKDILIVAGCDHKTGQPSSYKDTYGILENEIKKYYPKYEIVSKWNTEDCISLDKLPYIGKYSNLTPNMFVGTGFKKWGITLSNIAANIIVDNILGKSNRYAYLFDSTRLKPLKNMDEFKNVLVQSTNSLFLDKLKPANNTFENIKENSGSIIEINNEKVGIYKDENGKIHAVKPICTHLGCLLSWNDIDKTWDCPCHGSRFDCNGKNLYNPAFQDLEIYNLDD